MSDLKDRWENAIELYLLDRCWTKVAKKIKTTPQLISRWRSSPEFQEMLQARHDQVMAEVRCSTSKIYSQVVDRLQELICSEDNKTSLKAIELLLGHVDKNRNFELEVKSFQKLQEVKRDEN